MEYEIAGLTYNIEKDSFGYFNIFDVSRYLKGLYKNEKRFKQRFLLKLKEFVIAYDRKDRLENLNLLYKCFSRATAFSFKEAFSISDDSLRALVFGTMNISEMIEELGHERISVEGKELEQKVYNENGSYELKKYSVVYEIHKVSGKKLDIEDCYAIKCWCTSTNKIHWLWLEGDYSNTSPLEGIASTFMVYKNMIPFIKAIKRQGDVLLFEMTKEVFPEGEIVSLTANQYFGLIQAQS